MKYIIRYTMIGGWWNWEVTLPNAHRAISRSLREVDAQKIADALNAMENNDAD
jgi:hypothetical protein